MADKVPYDDFADIYDTWCDSAPITRENKPFYVELMFEVSGPVAELGVGNGRICVEVARRGKHIFGVDSSTRILELCRARAEAAGVGDRLTLIHADFRSFELPQRAELIAIPFHTIGHLLTREDKLTAMRHIRGQLFPGGRFVFDHFVFDPDYPQQSGVPYLRADVSEPETGNHRLLWETTTRDTTRQTLHILAITEDLDENGFVTTRRCRRSNLSWLSPDEARSLIEEAGFEIEALYGGFDRAPFDGGSSREQVWIARRPLQ